MATIQDGKLLNDNQEGETVGYETEKVVETQQVDTLEDTPVPEDPAAATESENGDKVQKAPVEIEKCPTAVEAMSWKHLQMMEKGHQYCEKCKMVVDVTSSKVIKKKSHKNLMCSICHNVVTLLYRNWDMSKLEGFKCLPQEEAGVNLWFFPKKLNIGSK